MDQKDRPAVSLRVLVVDEDEGVRRAVCNALVRRGAEAEGVMSGETALLALETRRFNVIVAECHSAGMSGALLARLVALHSPGIPVVGYCGSGDKRELLKAGVEAVFEKPDGLPALLDHLLANRGDPS